MIENRALKGVASLCSVGARAGLYQIRKISYLCNSGGSGEIRTHERVPPSAVFKTAAFNHSATLPVRNRHYT